MDDNRVLLQQAVAEFIGPFALTFLGAGSIIMTGGEELVAIALEQMGSFRIPVRGVPSLSLGRNAI